MRVHCHERGLILDQLRQFFVHAAHSFLALCKRQKLPPPPFRRSDSRAARQIEELRAEIVSLKARLAQLSQAEQSGRVRPSGGSVTAESGCASPRVHTPADEGDVAFTDKALAAVLVRLDRLTQPQLMVVLDAAMVKLTADARCGWVHDVAQGLSQDEASLLLALQLKSRGATALLTVAGGQMSSSELAALVLAFLPRLETPEKTECFRAILGTMDVARVLQVRRERLMPLKCWWRGLVAPKPRAAAAAACLSGIASLFAVSLWLAHPAGSRERLAVSFRSAPSPRFVPGPYLLSLRPPPPPATHRWLRRCCVSRPTAPKCLAASSATCPTRSGGDTWMPSRPTSRTKSGSIWFIDVR